MIDENRQLFPFCIVWTVIPCISWLIPIIGHTGICNSEGIVNDFLGYHINKKNMAFNSPIKYVRLDIEQVDEYNQAIEQVNQEYRQRSHNLASNNCHHHVADVLNRIQYRGRTDWSQVNIWWMCIWESNYVNKCFIMKVYCPFIAMVLFAAFVFTTVRLANSS